MNKKWFIILLAATSLCAAENSPSSSESRTGTTTASSAITSSRSDTEQRSASSEFETTTSEIATGGESTPSSATSREELSKEKLQKISEAFGHLVGSNLSSPGIEFDLPSIIRGLENAQAGKPSPMTREEYEGAMTQIQEVAFNRLATENLEKANQFIVETQQKSGVTEVVPGKVMYEVVEQGKGTISVEKHGTPLVHYTGTYLDGSTFGSSKDAGGPITLPLDQTIPGFEKALLGMKTGEKRRIFIHPDEGYGKFGHLAPNALLTFDVEIVSCFSPEDTASLTAETQDAPSTTTSTQ